MSEASEKIDQHIRGIGGWRGEALARMRRLIRQADPGVVEEWKWGGPVWSLDGIITTGETYKNAVKLTFAHGADLPDPKRLFNSSLEGKTRRAIDLHEGGKVDERAFKTLVKAAIARNRASGKPKAKAAKAAKAARRAKLPVSKSGAVLLSGGNPQVAAANGDAPVQEYIRAMPGWKRAVGERLDQLIERTLPGVTKAVKWNSPFYGVAGEGFIVSFHVFAKYVKVTFFRGADLKPMPPESSKDRHTRYLHVYEDEPLDEAQFAKWLKQAAKLPGFLATK